MHRAVSLAVTVSTLLFGAPAALATSELGSGQAVVSPQSVATTTETNGVVATIVRDTRAVVTARGDAQRLTLSVTLPWTPRSLRVEGLVNGSWRLLSTSPTATWVPPHTGENQVRVTYRGSSGLYAYVSTHRVMVWRNTAFTRYAVVMNGVTRVNGVIVLNKGFRAPATYAPGRSAPAEASFVSMQRAARAAGVRLGYSSAYRSYALQSQMYWGYVSKSGQAVADTYSARPGHSEHQAGLAYDLTGSGVRVAGGTATDRWLRANAHRYGFILRYPPDRSAITGYRFEPWHYRYLGVTAAAMVHASGVTLDEYLGVVRPTYG